MRSIILFTVLFPACTSLVPTTLGQLSALNPLEADPADLAVSVELPAGLGIEPASARLAFTVQRSDLGDQRAEIFVLTEAYGIYAIDPGDFARLQGIQQLAREWKEIAPDQTRGSISLGLGPCRIGAGPDEDARVNVGVRTAEEGPFLPLVVNGPITAVAKNHEIDTMPQCP